MMRRSFLLPAFISSWHFTWCGSELSGISDPYRMPNLSLGKIIDWLRNTFSRFFSPKSRSFEMVKVAGERETYQRRPARA